MPRFQPVNLSSSAHSPARAKISGPARSNGPGELGFEAKLWATADALRNNMDAAEYKHVVLGLIFLKYISDAFEATHTELTNQRAHGAEPEDPDDDAPGCQGLIKLLDMLPPTPNSRE